MKKLIKIGFVIAFLLLLQSCFTSSKPNISFFRDGKGQYKEATFTSINPPLFIAKKIIISEMKKDGDQEKLIAIIKKISDIKVLKVENGDKKMMRDFDSYLSNNKYEDWVTVKHDGHNVNVKAQQDGENIHQLMLTVNEDKELFFVDVKGLFTVDDISMLINEVQKN